MVWNDALPKIEVDPETYTVKADGRVLTCEPARSSRWRSATSCFERRTGAEKTSNPLSSVDAARPPPPLTVQLIPAILPDASLASIALRVDRHTLAKRLWRGTAEDGREFGFELAAPLKHGDTSSRPTARYVVHQYEEPVVEISLDIPPSAAAGIGWAVGNLHLELSSGAHRLLAPDEPAVRQLLDRLKVPFKPDHRHLPARPLRPRQPNLAMTSDPATGIKVGARPTPTRFPARAAPRTSALLGDKSDSYSGRRLARRPAAGRRFLLPHRQLRALFRTRGPRAGRRRARPRATPRASFSSGGPPGIAPHRASPRRGSVAGARRNQLGRASANSASFPPRCARLAKRARLRKHRPAARRAGMATAPCVTRSRTNFSAAPRPRAGRTPPRSPPPSKAASSAPR
jgi:urease accessory protein